MQSNVPNESALWKEYLYIVLEVLSTFYSTLRLCFFILITISKYAISLSTVLVSRYSISISQANYAISLTIRNITMMMNVTLSLTLLSPKDRKHK